MQACMHRYDEQFRTAIFDLMLLEMTFVKESSGGALWKTPLKYYEILQEICFERLQKKTLAIEPYFS